MNEGRFTINPDSLAFVGNSLTFRTPDMYQFDFTKINSIEDIGKVLEVLCSQLRISEEIVAQHGVEDITKKVER